MRPLDVQLGEEPWRVLASRAGHSSVDQRDGLGRSPLVRSLVGHPQHFGQWRAAPRRWVTELVESLAG